MSSSTPCVRVTRSFLLNLANEIYNPATRTFMKLCDGALKGDNNKKTGQPMHCGLGELYFAMTGKQPVHISESGVVEMALRNSPLHNQAKDRREAALVRIRSMGLPAELQANFVSEIEDCEEFSAAEDAFREALDSIPDVNDNGCGEDFCSYDTYRSRAAQVARKLREAAKHVPV